MSTKKELWVFAEQRDGKLAGVVHELLGEGRALADKAGYTLAAVLFSADGAVLCPELFRHGAEKIYTVDDSRLADYQNDFYTHALSELIKERQPEVVLLGGTIIGRSLAPSVAAKIGAGLTADCTALDIDPETGNLQQTRPAFGGNLMATIICPNHRPQMATVRTNVFKKPATLTDAVGERVECSIDFTAIPVRMRRVEAVHEKIDTIDLHAAHYVVAGGRGVGRPENFKLISELATEMGAAVGASRAIVDAEWVSLHHQVGLSGKTVCPVVYLACGISGAIQHLAGMQAADVIVAINTDSSAPIFDVADYGLVGDLREIVPELQRQLAAFKT